MNFSRSVAGQKDLKHVTPDRTLERRTNLEIIMSSHVVPCYPMSSHVIPCQFHDSIYSMCFHVDFFFHPKLHLNNFRLEHFQAESHLKPVTSTLGSGQFLNVADKCRSGRDTKQSCNFLVQLGILAFVSF